MTHHGMTRFNDNLEAFFSGLPTEPSDLGRKTIQPDKEADALLDELVKEIAVEIEAEAALDELDELAPVRMDFSIAEREELEEVAATTVREPIGTHVSPYDRAIIRRVEIERQREALHPDNHVGRLALQAALAAAEKKIKVELARSKDDEWRKRSNIDEWRSGIGRDEYNAGRRQRETSNVSRKDETDEERGIRRNAEKAASKARKRAEMTDEERAEARRLDAERKRAARTRPKA